MTVFDNFKSKNIDELAEWLSEHGMYDQAPWWRHWDKNYCNKCESINVYIPSLEKETECAWCEIHNKCKFFQDMSEIPSSKEIIKMWLLSEVEE